MNERETSTAKGSRENPLSILDLPFTVPKAGRYWLTYGTDKPMQLPHAPKGSVICAETRGAET